MGRTPSPQLKAELERIRRTKVYEEVAQQLHRLIVEGHFKPGDKLPTERELAEAFGVSRASVRDAVRSLELLGLVEPRQGQGRVVRPLSPDGLVRPLASVLVRNRALLGELLEVRKMLEPPIAARAAQLATAEEVARLEEILDRQAEKLRQGELPIDEDTEFHYAIATAARNSVILQVMDVLMDLLLESRQQSLQVQGRPQKSVEGHRAILEGIRRRDPQATEAAMRQHLEEIEATLAAHSEAQG